MIFNRFFHTFVPVLRTLILHEMTTVRSFNVVFTQCEYISSKSPSTFISQARFSAGYQVPQPLKGSASTITKSEPMALRGWWPTGLSSGSYAGSSFMSASNFFISASVFLRWNCWIRRVIFRCVSLFFAHLR